MTTTTMMMMTMTTYFMCRYGIDYRDRACYDIVLDMSQNSAAENLQRCIDRLLAFDVLLL